MSLATETTQPDALPVKVPPVSRWGVIKERLDLGNTMGWLGAYLLICLIVGAVAGAVWYFVVDLPGYTLDESFYASMSEPEHAKVFSADAWLVALGLVAATGLGWLAWRWFGRLGWPSAVVALLAGLTAGFIAQRVGHLLGPDDLAQRLANEQPSATKLIPVELTSHTPVYLAAWAALALLPVLIASALAPTAKDPRGWQRLEK
jgi:hypothetical protein